MNKTLKMVLAAAGALVLGGLGEGLGAELLKKVARAGDATEDITVEDDAKAEEPVEVEISEEIPETTED